MVRSRLVRLAIAVFLGLQVLAPAWAEMGNGERRTANGDGDKQATDIGGIMVRLPLSTTSSLPTPSPESGQGAPAFETTPSAVRPPPSAEPLAQATPISDVIEQVTQPTATPAPGLPTPDPVSFRIESTPTNEFSSNVTQQVAGLNDLVLKLPISASLGYRMPWGMQGVVGYQFQTWKYLRLKENNLSLHLGTLVLSQPIGGFASAYAGYQAIVKVAENGTGLKRFDNDLLLGISFYKALGQSLLAYVGYQFDTLIAEAHATAFNGHSANLGFKQALLPNLLITGKYRFQHRQPLESRVVATNLHIFGLDLQYRPANWLTGTIRGDYILNRFNESTQRNFNYYLIGLGLAFGLDNTMLAPARPVGRPTPRPTLQPTPVPTLAPTPLPSALPTPALTVQPSVGPTPKPTVRPTARPTIKRVPAGATLRHLAQWYYGNENLWPIMARANKIKNPDWLRPGQPLVIPLLKLPRRPLLKVGELPLGVIAVVTYRSGMHLGDLAWKFYGNAARWREIARFNGIANPLAIPPGMQLLIPK